MPKIIVALNDGTVIKEIPIDTEQRSLYKTFWYGAEMRAELTVALREAATREPS